MFEIPVLEMLPVDAPEDLLDIVLRVVSALEVMGLDELNPLRPDMDTLGDLLAIPALEEGLELDKLGLPLVVAEKVVADTLGV